MALADYYDLQDTVARWLERYDVTEYIPDLITAAETRIADDIKLRAMETAFSATLADGDTSVTYPSDCLNFKGGLWRVEDGVRSPLTERTEEYIKLKYVEGEDGTPTDFYVTASDTIVFGVVSDKEYTIEGTYYKKLELSDSNLSHWILEKYPYVIIYATLIESMIFLEDDPRRFEAMYLEQLDRMRRNENRTIGSAGPRMFRQCALDGWQGNAPRGQGVDSVL